MLSLMGNGLLRNLSAPAKPSDLFFKAIVDWNSTEISVTETTIHSRALPLPQEKSTRRWTRKYLPWWIKEVDTLYCESGTSLNDALRDRLVYGPHNGLIQKRLLSEPELTLAKPTEIALAMEAAAKDTLELQGSKRSEVYMVINGGNSEPNMKPKSCSHCYSCGGTTHKSSKCYFRNEAGRKCGKVGHINQVCRSRERVRTPPDEERRRNPICMPLRWMMNAMMIA